MVLSQGVGSSLCCSRVLLPDLLWVQVFGTPVPVTEKTREYLEVVTPWMSLHPGVRTEDLAMALPIHPVSHSKRPFTELCALFVPVPTGISFVFSSACHTRRLSVSIQPGLPWEGRKTVDVTNCIRARRFAVTSSFHAGFLIEF